jgi:Protein of unknown function (DUF3592)
VLERKLPTDSFRVMGLLIAALTLIGVIVAIGMDTLAAGLRTLLPNPAVTPFEIAFTIFAVVLLLMAVLARQESKKVASWPETEGTILSSSFDTFRTRTGIDRFAMRILVHRPRVIYAFDVGGTRYQGERISLGVSKYASLKFLVGRDVRRYKSGDKVVVCYDPANPAQAVLNRTDVRPRVYFAFSALFALGAIWASSAA